MEQRAQSTVRTPVLLRTSAEHQAPEYFPGVILDEDDRHLMAEFEPEGGPFELGTTKTLFFRRNEEFLQQAWCIVSTKNEGDKIKVLFNAVDVPECGEHRGVPRHPTAFAGLTAQFGGEKDCLVLDVGDDGVAIDAAGVYEIGEDVWLELHASDTGFSGHVTVRSIVAGERGRTRYGVQCHRDEYGNPQSSLPHIWLTMCLEQNLA